MTQPYPNLSGDLSRDPPKSVLHLGKYYPPDRGGMETAVQQLSELGSTLGHRVACWVAASDHVAPGATVSGGIMIDRLKPWFKLRSAPWYPELFRRSIHDFDLVHLHLPNPTAELFCWFRKPRCLIPYFHAFPVSQGLLGRMWFQLVTRPLLKRAKSILVSNRGLIEAFPVLEEFQQKIRWVPFYTASQMPIESSRRDSEPYLLTVGRLVAYKGLDTLLEGWAKARARSKEVQSWKLVIVGDGPEKEKLKSLCQSLDLGSSVMQVGELSDEVKDQWLKNASLYVCCSRTTAETFGISVLEAFSAGLPAVLSDLPGGLKVLARGGQCGAVFRRGDADALAEALVNLVSASSEKRKQVGAENRRFAQAEFSREKALDCYRQVLKEGVPE